MTESFRGRGIRIFTCSVERLEFDFFHSERPICEVLARFCKLLLFSWNRPLATDKIKLKNLDKLFIDSDSLITKLFGEVYDIQPYFWNNPVFLEKIKIEPVDKSCEDLDSSTPKSFSQFYKIHFFIERSLSWPKKLKWYSVTLTSMAWSFNFK